MLPSNWQSTIGNRQSRRRSVIVNDLPTLFSQSKNQTERAMRFVARTLQMPPSQHHRRIFSEQCDFQIGKGQCPHLLSCAVIFFVAFEDGLPTSSDVVARNKDCVIGPFVTVHVAVDITAVPGITLCFDDGTYSHLRLVRTWRFGFVLAH